MSAHDNRQKRRKARKLKARSGHADYEITWSWNDVHAMAPDMPLGPRIDLVAVTLYHENPRTTVYELVDKLRPFLAGDEYDQALDLLLDKGYLKPSHIVQAWDTLDAMTPADIKSMGARMGVDL